jgi:hypothetical protein
MALPGIESWFMRSILFSNQGKTSTEKYTVLFDQSLFHEVQAQYEENNGDNCKPTYAEE